MKLVTIYYWDGTKHFKEEGRAQVINGEVLLPMDATTVEPTFEEGKWTVWNGSEWIHESIPTKCEDALELSCISNSPLPQHQRIKVLLETLAAADSEHYKTVVDDQMVMRLEAIPEKTLEELKEAKLEELKAATSKFTGNDCSEMYIDSSIGYRVNADKTAQDNMHGLILAHDSEDTIMYKIYDNSFVPLTPAQLEIMLKECAANGENLYAQKFTYEQRIAAAATKEELDAIEINFTMGDFSNN